MRLHGCSEPVTTQSGIYEDKTQFIFRRRLLASFSRSTFPCSTQYRTWWCCQVDQRGSFRYSCSCEVHIERDVCVTLRVKVAENKDSRTRVVSPRRLWAVGDGLPSSSNPWFVNTTDPSSIRGIVEKKTHCIAVMVDEISGALQTWHLFLRARYPAQPC